MVGYVSRPGVHRFVVRTADSGTTDRGVSFTRTFVIPDVPYAVAALPDLGVAAGAVGINEGGDVAGWVTTAEGHLRPAVWRRGARGGALEVVPTAADANRVVAVRVNAAGDILLQYRSGSGPFVRVRRSDGVELPVGLPGPGAWPYVNLPSCCSLAADLTEARQALGTTHDSFFAYRAAVLDVARGVIVDSAVSRLTTMNESGQAAGTLSNAPTLYISTWLDTRGFTSPPHPRGAVYSVCDLPGRYGYTTAIDLDDDANVLASWCGNPVLLPNGGEGVWVDRHVGRGEVHLSKRGGLVASLDSAGAIHLWRLGTTTTSRARLLDTRWRVDRLAGVTSSGAIAAQGVDAAGRRAALLLVPAGTAR
jgi:hypothetical protein